VTVKMQLRGFKKSRGKIRSHKNCRKAELNYKGQNKDEHRLYLDNSEVIVSLKVEQRIYRPCSMNTLSPFHIEPCPRSKLSDQIFYNI